MISCGEVCDPMSGQETKFKSISNHWEDPGSYLATGWFLTWLPQALTTSEKVHHSHLCVMTSFRFIEWCWPAFIYVKSQHQPVSRIPHELKSDFQFLCLFRPNVAETGANKKHRPFAQETSGAWKRVWGLVWRIHVNPWRIPQKIWKSPSILLEIWSFLVTSRNAWLVQPAVAPQVDEEAWHFQRWPDLLEQSPNFPHAFPRKITILNQESTQLDLQQHV